MAYRHFGRPAARLAIRGELTATSVRAAERFLTVPGLCTENKILGEGAMASHEMAVVAQREAIGLKTAQRMAAENKVKSAAAEGAEARGGWRINDSIDDYVGYASQFGAEVAGNDVGQATVRELRNMPKRLAKWQPCVSSKNT